LSQSKGTYVLEPWVPIRKIDFPFLQEQMESINLKPYQNRIKVIMTSFAANSVPMSVFVPHVDDSFSFEDIAYQFEQKFEIGKLDRIEAVPKINQKDGHVYHACFLYFNSWGNGYHSQNLRLRLMETKQTRFYVTESLYWMVCPNTSDVFVEDLPMPKHMALALYVSGNHSLDDIVNTFDQMDLGKVNIQYTRLSQEPIIQQDFTVYKGISSTGSDIPWSHIMDPRAWKVVVEFDYWYHSKSSHEFQKMLESEKYVVLFPNISSRWIVTNYSKTNTAGVNPYTWYAPQYWSYNYDIECGQLPSPDYTHMDLEVEGNMYMEDYSSQFMEIC